MSIQSNHNDINDMEFMSRIATFLIGLLSIHIPYHTATEQPANAKTR